MSLDYAQLGRALAPEAFLVGGALLALGLDLTVLRQRANGTRFQVALAVGALAVLAALAGVLRQGASGEIFGGVLVIDSLAWVGRAGVLVLALLGFGAAAGGKPARPPAEFVAVFLFAVTGLTLMCAAQQLLIAFLALELASLSLYLLVAFDRTRSQSAEAGLKYFLFGGISAAFLLFGFSLLYGLTGSIDLPSIAISLVHQPSTPLLAVAVTMVVVAFGYKTAAAPFHLWAPDAYEGAPPAVAGLIASASKLAGVTLFVRLLWPGLFPAAGDVSQFHGGTGWLAVVAILAGCSILLGNLAALAQREVRRLLAYSAIAHAGSLLLGVMVAQPAGPGPLLYYAFTYGLATVGTFGVLGVLERHGVGARLTDLAGLRHRSPELAAMLAVFVLSLAGIPPLAGFLAKFAVYAAALRTGAGPASPIGALALLAIAGSALALYYYLLVLKQVFVVSAPSEAPPVRLPLVTRGALWLAAAALLGLGVWPSVIWNLF